MVVAARKQRRSQPPGPEFRLGHAKFPGADCSTKLNAAKAQTLYDNGYRIVGRYLTNVPGGLDKAITKVDAQAIFDAGLRFFPIYQAGGSSNTYFTQEQGIADAQAAIAAAIGLGIPGDTFIYFAVDYDATDYNITNNVIPYFGKVYEVMSKSAYKTGIYGARNVCDRVASAGYSGSSFVSNLSTGFSGNLGFRMPGDWAFDQFANLEGANALGTGDGRIEIDRNAVSGRDQGVGFLVSQSGVFNYAGQVVETHDSEATYYYEDAYFLDSADAYNSSLATMSLCFELSSWTSHETKPENSGLLKYPTSCSSTAPRIKLVSLCPLLARNYSLTAVKS
jgi:hypothetical protein